MKDEFKGWMAVVNAVDPAVIIQTDILEQCSRERVHYMVFRILMKRMERTKH